MLSYWEQQSFLHYDHIVIGSGFVGLSAAIEIKARFPQQRVMILERGLLPTGASSKNAGFACMGSITELLDDLKTVTEEEMIFLFEWRKKGLEKLAKRLGTANMGYQENGSHELIDASELEAIEQIDYLNRLLLPITGNPAFSLANEKIASFGFSKEVVKALVSNNCEGEIHSGKTLRALTDYAIEKGIEIKTGAEVLRFEEEAKQVNVICRNHFTKEEITFSGHSLTLCTNAFTKQLLPNVDVRPGRGQVLITQPIAGLKFKGIFHFQQGYYYFREIDGRVLFGGGRNLDFNTEATTDFDLNLAIQNDLDYKLRTLILPDTPFEIDRRWTGIMAFGPTKQPIVQAFSDKVFGAFRMGGMGVALGSEVAVQVAELMKDTLF
jgi:glycine/D-amino acid oxidase-like deaminating enzyme